MSQITDEELLNEIDLLDEVKQVEESNRPTEEKPPVEEKVEAPINNEPAEESHVGKKLDWMPGQRMTEQEKKQRAKDVEDQGLGKVGDNIFEKAAFREGWIDVNRKLLGERDIFYPEDWRFRIRPATVEAIRNWSTIDDDNLNSIDDVFNEILKACVSIVTPAGNIPVGNIASWDRFFFLLLVRQYTFAHGESKIQWDDEQKQNTLFELELK